MNYFLNKTKRIQKNKRNQQKQDSVVNVLDDQDSQYLMDYPTFNWDQYYTPFRLMLSLGSQFDPTDQTLAWACNLPAITTATRVIYFTLKKGTFVRRHQLYQQVPASIHLCCDGVQGYLDNNGQVTQRIGKFSINNINIQEQILQSGQVNSFQLVTYKLQSDTFCQIQPIVRMIKLRLKQDDSSSYTQLPTTGFCLEAVISRKLTKLNEEKQ